VKTTTKRSPAPYTLPEWAAFVVQMRAAPDDRVTPAVAADWLEEHGKVDHARFVRGCVRIADLRGTINEGFKTDRSYPNPDVLGRELFDLVNGLRPLINRYAHEWTGGYWRKFDNPTVYDLPLGFVRACRFRPLKEGSDRERDHLAHKKFRALLVRQPVHAAHLALPAQTFAPPSYYLDLFVQEYRGVSFRHGAEMRDAIL
jgi:uncharacterized protein (TIGR02996 family)